jgi:uncharacterized protein (DUF1778 family)
MRARPTVSLTIRVAPKVREAIEQAAKDSERTIRDFVENALIKATERRAAEQKPAA